MAKIQKRNKELHDERVRLPRREIVTIQFLTLICFDKRKRQQRAKANSQLESTEVAAQGPHPRYSATAGVEQPPQRQRTWTVQDEEDDKVHRGGQEHSNKRSRKVRKISPNWGTGVNSIPLRS